MATLKRATLGLVIGVVVLGILLTLVSHFSLKFLNSPILKKRIQAGFLEYLNTQIDYNTLKISFFPKPHLEINQGVLSIEKQASSKFISADVYPKLLPLLTGKFRFSKVVIGSSETKIVLSQETAAQTQDPTEAIINVWRQIAPWLAYMAGSEVDDVSIQTTNARMDLYKGDRLLISVWDLDWRVTVPGENVIYSVSCRSNFWERLSNKGVIHRQKKITEGEIKIERLRLLPVQAQFFSNAEFTLGDTPIDLELGYVTDGRKTFNARLKSSFSALPLTRGQERLTLSGRGFNAGLSIDGRKIDVSISSLKLDSPKIDLAGKFSINPAASQALIEINGKNADVASVRKAVLFFAGDIPDVADIFHVVRAGRVPEFAIRSEAASIDDLDTIQNIRITGQMVDGNIFVPGIAFDLTAVNGQADISKGILEGTNLSARLEKTTGKEGRMTIDLDNHRGPFRLDILVDADLSRLPPVLSRLIDHKAFQQELKRIHNVSGRAHGRLILGDSLSSVRPRIDVSKFVVKADYQRVPFPLSVTGERLTIEDTRLAASGLTVTSRGGKLSGLHGGVDWGKIPAVDATVGESTLKADAVYAWLQSLAVFQKRMALVSSVKGSIHISSAQVKGNYLHPERIAFTMKGHAEGLAADVTAVGSKVYIDQGNFSASRKALLFSEVKMRFLDASLNASGTIDRFIEADTVRSIDITGVLGARAVQWASALIRLPSEFTIRPPLRISSAHLTTGGGKPTSFSGKLAVQKGPSVDIEVSDESKGFMINHLRIADSVSHADLALQMKNRVCDLSFKGRIEKSTLDAFLTDNRVVTGWVEGDIQTWIHLDNPIKSTAIGKLTGEGFMVFLPVTSLKVDYLSLEAVSNHLKIDAARIVWIDEPIDLSGDLSVLDKKVKIDLDVDMDHFDWNQYGNLITGRKAHESGKTDLGKDISFLEGTIRFTSHHFRYGTFTWRPFTADVTFRPNYLMIDVHKANLCNISMPGMATIHPDSVELTIGTVANGESLDDTLYCLGKPAYVIEGRFDLEGYVSMKGDKTSKIMPELNGEWKFSARDGHINRLTVLSKIFELLNVAEIFKLKLPDLKTEGFDYKKIDINWRLDGGKVIIDAGRLDSAAMEIAFKGKLDLIRDKADVLVLVAPLQTLNLIVKNIPIVRHILAGTFISIPFRVEGDLQNPEVSAMNPMDVGSEMLNLLKRTADVPMQIIQPLTNLAEKSEQPPAP